MNDHRDPGPSRRQRTRRPTAHSWLEIDLGAIRHNVRALKRLLGPGRHLWAVVKANAYGHGAAPVGRAAVAAGADGLAVACLTEAAELRRAGVSAPILLLAAGEPRAAARTVRLDLVQTACAEDTMRALSKAAQRLGRPARVHLKIDTGMGRLGVRPGEAAGFARLIESLPGLSLEGVFSHLATAESEDRTYADTQFERFQEALGALAGAGIAPGMRHLANSAATLRFPEMRLDGVRTGLLLYGLLPDAPCPAAPDVRPALTWKTSLGFLHRLPAGSPVSYGGTHVTSRETPVGVLPLGYADGYPRHASNRAQVLVRGRGCPVIGVVCMDHTMVDLGPAPDARVGEEVVLVGRQGDARITANQLAQWAGSVVHEVPTVIGKRVRRVYLDREQPLDPGFAPEGGSE
jgi:alanine racemase